jgi:hypothetical protein
MYRRIDANAFLSSSVIRKAQFVPVGTLKKEEDKDEKMKKQKK